MSKINILTKDVYTKIAAGEVVDKPASVVKELVENSIDAHATNITIEILDGGITQIKVSDNGSGIDADDFNKVFLPHATSKIKSIADLNKIGTLGFRGEALASIAAVSKVTLSSKTESDDEGHQIKVFGGEMEDIVPIGATTGTYIVVDELFYNIPARKKFLKKPKQEETEITNYVSRLILANPNISIKYIADNKIVYQSYGSGLYDAIYSIYGKSIVDNIFSFEFSRDNYKFYGYLGKPTYTKPNRTYQTLIINGRYVINQTVSTSVFRAYENHIMKNSFPFYVINMEIPLDKVDVNVHPNKLDVKFEDNNLLFGIIYSEISNILYHINDTKKITTEDDDSKENVDISKLENTSNIGTEFNKLEYESNEIKEVSLVGEKEHVYESNKEKNDEIDFKNKINETTAQYKINNSVMEDFDFKVQQPNTVDNNEGISIPDSNVDQQSIQLLQDASYKIIGTIFNTYILVEKNNKVLLIDQHAGHERILFDKFNKDLESQQINTQPLLIPYVIDCNYMEAQFIKENITLINSMGFDISEFGDNSFKISSEPVVFNNIDISQIFDNILNDIDNNLILSKQNVIRDYIAKKACKAAVKANDCLSDSEIDHLVTLLNNENQVLLCPHGRPIVVELDKKEIEKWFKRIV